MENVIFQAVDPLLICLSYFLYPQPFRKSSWLYILFSACDTFSIVYYSSPGILAFEGQYLDRPSQDIWECGWIRFYFDATMIEKEGVIVSYFSRLSITYFSWLYWGDNFFSVLILFSFTSEYVCMTQNKVMTALGDDLSTWENGNQQFCLDWAWTSLESMAVVWPYYVAGTKKLL